MSQCRKTFKTSHMTVHVRCDLPAGHKHKYCQHDFGMWCARVWPRKAGGVTFRYVAKKGQGLPKRLDYIGVDT